MKDFTAKHYAEIIKAAKMVIWNGPMGLSEIDAFAEGTRIVAEAVASVGQSIIGGGDTIAAVNKLDLLDKYKNFREELVGFIMRY